MLVLCRDDLSDITRKLKSVTQTQEQNEEQFRADIIEKGRKMVELRREHEKQAFELREQSDGSMNQIRQEFE